MTASFKEFIKEGLRLLHTVGNGRRTAKVYKDAEWGEYRVKHYTDGEHHKEADAHTDHKEDAMGTAANWVKPTTEAVDPKSGKLFPR